MKKDIELPKVTDITVAIIPADEMLWDVYLINEKTEDINNIIVNCKGFGERNGEKVETSQMRYFIEKVKANTAVKVEPIAVELFDLTHQYWISFQHNGTMLDKKYIFEKGTLSENNFSNIPFLETKGVMIK